MIKNHFPMGWPYRDDFVYFLHSGIFFMFFLSPVDFFPKINRFKNNISGTYCHNVKRFGTKSGPT